MLLPGLPVAPAEEVTEMLSALNMLVRDPASLAPEQALELRTILDRHFDASQVPDSAGLDETARTPTDSSKPAGIIRHGEHWADLILSQGGSSDPRYLRAFDESARSLLEQARAGSFARVNEKIDGSPSIVLGFTADNRPFVTYKGDIGMIKGEPRLVTSEQEASSFRGPLVRLR